MQAHEEVSVSIKTADVRVLSVVQRTLHLGNGNAREYLDFFVTAPWQGDIVNREPDKCSALQFFDPHSLPDSTIDYVRYAITLVGHEEWPTRMQTRESLGTRAVTCAHIGTSRSEKTCFQRV